MVLNEAADAGRRDSPHAHDWPAFVIRQSNAAPSRQAVGWKADFRTYLYRLIRSNRVIRLVMRARPFRMRDDVDAALHESACI
jgi:hypothetical protein